MNKKKELKGPIILICKAIQSIKNLARRLIYSLSAKGHFSLVNCVLVLLICNIIIE